MDKLSLSTKEFDNTWFGIVTESDGSLLASSFGQSKEALEDHLRLGRHDITIGATGTSDGILEQMIKLYRGNPVSKPVRLNWEAVPEFQRNVCQAMQEIPRGKVTSYGLIARKLGSGPRAVGTGVSRNPWPLFVPCHRVVPADLEIGNYSIGGSLSDYGCAVKRDLLEREGVLFEGDRVVSKALWTPGA